MPDQSTTHFEAPLSCRFLIWNMCFNGLRNRSRPEKRRCCHHAGPIPAHNIEGDPHHRIDERNLDQREESKPLKPRSSPSPDPLTSAVIQREEAPASQHASGQLQIIRASCAIGQSALSLAPRCGVGSAAQPHDHGSAEHAVLDGAFQRSPVSLRDAGDKESPQP